MTCLEGETRSEIKPKRTAGAKSHVIRACLLPLGDAFSEGKGERDRKREDRKGSTPPGVPYDARYDYLYRTSTVLILTSSAAYCL